MKKSRASLVVAAVAAVGMMLTSCGASTDASPVDDNTPHELIVAIERSFPGGWLPVNIGWSTMAQLNQAAYDGFFRGTPEGEFEPALATEGTWESDTEFRMKLREGVTFSDGEKFEGEAVKTHLEWVKAGGTAASDLIAPLEEVEVVGDHEVVLHFSAFVPEIYLILSQHVGQVVSPAAIADEAVLLDGPVGAGPYIFDASSSVSENTFAFTKNPDYWNADDIAFDSLTFRVIDDAQAAFNALQAGEVDMSWARYPNVAPAEAAGFEIFEGPGTVSMIQFIDMAGAEIPAMGDPRVRQALNLAVNREAIAESISPGRVTSQWSNVDSEAYDPELDDMWDYDPAKAEKLLTDAGYADGFSFPVLTTPVNQQMLEVVAADLAAVGVTVDMVIKPIAEFVPAATAGEYAGILVPFTSNGATSDFTGIMLPEGATNTRSYDDPEAVALFRAAVSERDDDARRAAWQEVSRYFTEDAWTIPIQQTTTYYFYDGDVVTGVERAKGTTLPSIYWIEPAS